jgi:hypothetical protein
VAWSPPLDDLRLVLLDHLAVRSGGFYPKGEGEVVVEAEGPLAGPLFRRSERGPLQELRIASFASEELASLRVAERPELSLRRSPRERRWTNTRPTSLIPWLAVCGGSRRASRLSEDARTNPSFPSKARQSTAPNPFERLLGHDVKIASDALSIPGLIARGMRFAQTPARRRRINNVYRAREGQE